jgi:hypothetical protein
MQPVDRLCIVLLRVKPEVIADYTGYCRNFYYKELLLYIVTFGIEICLVNCYSPCLRINQSLDRRAMENCFLEDMCQG